MPHDECVGPQTETVEGRFFDTISNQIDRNGDRGKRMIVKIDIEGAEWASLVATPDEVRERIDQLAMEFHGVDDAGMLSVVGSSNGLFTSYICISTTTHVTRLSIRFRPGRTRSCL